MIDPATQTLLLGALLGGSVEAVAGAAVQPAFSALATKIKAALGGQAAGAWERAVSRAFEQARRLVEESASLGSPELRGRVAVLLTYGEVAEEVSRRLLFGERPDLDRLLNVYRKIAAVDGSGVTKEEVVQVEMALVPCLDLISSELERDAEVGGLIAQARQLATLARLESAAIVLAQHTAHIESHTSRVAAASETSAGHTGEMVQIGRMQLAKFDALATSLRGKPGATARRGGSKPRGSPPLDLTTAETAYLRALVSECERLPLAEDKRRTKERQDKVLPAFLSRVYVDLATTSAPPLDVVFDRLRVPATRRQKLREELRQGLREVRPPGLGRLGGEEEDDAQLLQALTNLDGERVERQGALWRLAKDRSQLKTALAPMTALESLAEKPHWVLLGAPGSGKSTFLQHLSTTFAQALLGESTVWTKTLEGRFSEPFFPVRVVLRRWAAALPKRRPSNFAILKRGFANLSEDVPWGRWQKRLGSPLTLVLFDGLDEVPISATSDDAGETQDRRRWLVAAIEDFCVRFPRCKVITTCRVRPYREGAHRLSGWPTRELAPLDRPRIEGFSERWHQEMVRICQLSKANAEPTRARLLAAVFDSRKKALGEMAQSPLLLTMLAKVNLRNELPEGRAALFKECTQQLLWEWEKSKAEDLTIESLPRLLDEAPQSISPRQFERMLWELAYEVHDTVKEATADVPAVRLREKLESLGARGRAMNDWSFRVVELLQKRDGLLVARDQKTFTFPHRSFQEYLAALWLTQQSDVVGAAYERAAQEIWYEVVLLVCGHLAEESLGTLFRLLEDLVKVEAEQTDGAWRRALLAGRAWLDLRAGHLTAPDEPARKRQTELREALPGPLTCVLQSSEVPAAQRLEAGEILADLSHLPAGLADRVVIPADRLGYAFQIGKYPVANEVFREFVEDGGYRRDRPWWSEQARKDLEKYNDRWPDEPRWWHDLTWNRATFPVVGLSWYEAKAYCAWLESKLRGTQEFGEGESVALPTAAEWEAAARGPGSGKYPWGDEPDPARANTEESQLGRTTPVHLYPAQSREPKMWDLAGNVWEWLEDRDDDGWPYLAGGAFYNELDGVGAAARFRGPPEGLWDLSFGFRVVVVPSSRRSSDS